MSAGNQQSTVIGGVDITQVQDEDIAFELGAEEVVGDGPLTQELQKEASQGGPLTDRLNQMDAAAAADPAKADSLDEAESLGELEGMMGGGDDREDEDEDTGDFEAL